MRTLQGRPVAPRRATAGSRRSRYWKTLPTRCGRRLRPRGRPSTRGASRQWSPGARARRRRCPSPSACPTRARAADPGRRARMERMLAYMGLARGHAARPASRSTASSSARAPTAASTTCAPPPRWRAAAARVVPALVVPGSGLVKAAAEARGSRPHLPRGRLRVARRRAARCASGMNGDLGRAGERIASTSNRNFEGRQGKGVRTHLMSPAMAAAAAVTGRHHRRARALGGLTDGALHHASTRWPSRSTCLTWTPTASSRRGSSATRPGPATSATCFTTFASTTRAGSVPTSC